MKRPGIQIDVMQGTFLADDGLEIRHPFQDVTIWGNRAGLLELAKLIHKVAMSDQDGYHIHMYPDDEPPLVRSREFSLTVGKDSLK